MTAEEYTPPTSDPTTLLTRSNLLRLETSELLAESTLHIHPPQSSLSTPHHSNGGYVTGEERAHYEVKWSPTVRRYLHTVNDVLAACQKAMLSPDVCEVTNNNGSSSSSTSSKDGRQYRVPLYSDKFIKHTQGETWEFASPSGYTLQPVGSFGHIGNAGLTNRHANGNNVPVLDVAVLMEGEGFVGGKDYLNGRYADKRNILAIHIAELLSQKKHHGKIGAVHITPVFGDSRKIGLLLTPPLEKEVNANESSKSSTKKKRKKDKSNKSSIKTRFRIRLLFGMKNGMMDGYDNAGSNNNKKSMANDEDEMEMIGENEWNCWIPRTRLFPDRSNNRSEKAADSKNLDGERSTPHYTNDLAEDMHYVSTTKMISSMITTLVGGNVSNNDLVSTSFHETLILLKVWALQRGFLRGHDTFTTTTLAVLLVYLYRTKGIARRMGAMQAFTAFMKFWSETDWLGEDTLSATACQATGTLTKAEVVLQRKLMKKAAFVIPEEGRNESQTTNYCEQARLYLKDVRGSNDSRVPKTLLESYKFHYTSSSSKYTVCDSHHDSPILLDSTMMINYLARLSPSFVRESRAEAHAALIAIHGHEREEAGGGAFRKLFLQTNRFWTRYDAYFRIPVGRIPKLATADIGKKKNRSKSKKVNASSNRVWGKDSDDLGYNESVCRGIVEVLTLALGDRATAVRALTCGNGDIRSSSTDESADENVTKCMTDSDQYLALPIRGSGRSDKSYGDDLSMRAPAPPVLCESQREQFIVVGLSIDPNNSRRVVDRGPPAEDIEGSRDFMSLWGEKLAQIRRFQDGAIVRAVVWNTPSSNLSQPQNTRYSGDDRLMGGIVEKVAQHVVNLHFESSRSDSSSSKLAFELRNMMSFIDGVSSEKPSHFSDSLTLHKNAISAFDSLSDFLRRNTALIDAGNGKMISKLGLPLPIDEVMPLSPCLRYSSLFPPISHPSLGGASNVVESKISGAIDGQPILIQIRFQSNSKWPSSLNAMAAAKCAMLIQLADGIQKMKAEKSDDIEFFDGPVDNTPDSLTLGYRGYSWRIVVHAVQELRMLKGLKNPTDEAIRLQQALINRHVRGSMHHSLIHAVHTRHPSSSAVVRLASRWVASHMLSDMISHEAIELMVARIYTNTSENTNSRLHSIDAPPSTVMAGFLRFLQLLFAHDWAREPLIVDPQNHISSHDRSLIRTQFDAIRGPDFNKGPAMWIVSPADYDGVEEMTGSKIARIEDETPQTSAKLWAPSITATLPEKVVLSRAAALAKRSRDHLITCMVKGDSGNKWAAAFQESPASLTSYSALLRVDTDFMADTGCSSTESDCALISGDKTPVLQSPFERSVQKRFDGPKSLRKKHYKNLVLDVGTLLEWNPVKSLVATLRSEYGDYALFFYNEYCPDIIAVLWRPTAFIPESFSAMVSSFKHPVVQTAWREDTLVATNTDDLIYEIACSSKDIVTNIKILEDKKQRESDEPGVKRHKSEQS